MSLFSTFDINKMIKPNPKNEIYFFPAEYYPIVKDYIYSLNKVIEAAEQLCSIFFPQHIERENIHVKPNSDSCYNFSVMEYIPVTPTGKPSKYPQCVTIFVYEDLERKPYWNGRIFYDQNGEIGKGILTYRTNDINKEIMSYHITFVRNVGIKKVSKVLRSGGEAVQIYP